jgi:hypothetical protein
MIRVMGLIEQKQRALVETRFFAFLRDRSISPSKRLAFAPCGAAWIMSFADLNRYVIHVDDPQDGWEQLLNVHSEEDATHYDMYLHDLEVMGYDAPMRFGDALRFLWSPDRRQIRLATQELRFLLGSSPLELRLVVIETMEAIGAVAFRAFAEVAEEYRAETGKTLRYFGREHEAAETGHTIGATDIEDRLKRIVFGEEDAARARQLVEAVFSLLCGIMDELYRYAKRLAVE